MEEGIVPERIEEELDGVQNEPFDFEKFCRNLKNSIREDTDDVDLRFYLSAYQQLQNFFLLLGTGFQFVASDVRSKIKILHSYQQKDNAQATIKHFSTVKTMVWYEMHNKLLTTPKYVSGSRTLLRLHRGLNFVRKFLAEIYRIENNVKLGNVAKEVYNETLAQYHGWIVRSGAKAAMQFLPSRKELLKKISESNEEKLSHILGLFPDALEAMDIVYDRIQNIYSVNNLLELP